MSERVYKKIEIVGTSSKSIEDAVNQAIGRAGQSLHNLRWFEVQELRGAIEKNKVSQWQATVKIGFALDDEK